MSEKAKENDSSLLLGFQHMKKSIEFLMTLSASYEKSSRGRALIETYIAKLKWCMRDFLSTPQFSQEIRDALRNELNSDPFVVDDLMTKMALIPANQKEMIEKILDMIIDGEEIKIADLPD